MKKIFLEAMGISENGALTEKISDIIYSLLVNEIEIKHNNYGNTSIDFNSFNVASLKRSDWISAFSLENEKSRELINNLLMASESILTVNSNNCLRIIPIENQEVIIKLTVSDVLSDNMGFPDIQISYSKTVFNSFRVFYRLDYETKEYIKSEYISDNSTSLSEQENSNAGQSGYYTGRCLSSLERSGKTEEYIVKCNYIRDRNTAVKLLKHLTGRLTFKKEIIVMKTLMNEKTLALEIGDLVELFLPERNLTGKNYLVFKIIVNLLQKNMIVSFYQID